MSEFFAMGGYGTFVWPAYILFAGVQLVLAIRSWRWQRQIERDVIEIKAERDVSGQSAPVEKSQDEAE